MLWFAHVLLTSRREKQRILHMESLFTSSSLGRLSLFLYCLSMLYWYPHKRLWQRRALFDAIMVIFRHRYLCYT